MVEGDLPAPVGEGSVERLRFAPGTSSATVQGTVTGYAHIDYVIGLREGQSLNVSMSTDNGANYFNLLAPGETDVAYFNGSSSDNQFEGTVPATGVHRIRVYLMRSAARRNESGNFRLEVIAQNGGQVNVASNRPSDSGSRDIVRGAGGLEDRCHDSINALTDGKVIGTNRIEESQAAIEIYVNVAGVEEPWRCRGYRDGSMDDPEYTGSEGYL